MKTVELPDELYETFLKLKEIFLTVLADKPAKTMTDDEIFSTIVAGYIGYKGACMLFDDEDDDDINEISLN